MNADEHGSGRSIRSGQDQDSLTRPSARRYAAEGAVAPPAATISRQTCRLGALSRTRSSRDSCQEIPWSGRGDLAALAYTAGAPLIMDLLDRLLAHDEWTTQQLLILAHSLTEAQWTQPFDIGHVTLRATLEHMIYNVETWTALMNGEENPEEQPPFDGLSPADLAVRHQAGMAALTALAHRVRDAGEWDVFWVDILDDPPQAKTYGGAILHVITHNMHHRSEVMHMLHRLGVKHVIEGDLLSWEAVSATTPS